MLAITQSAKVLNTSYLISSPPQPCGGDARSSCFKLQSGDGFGKTGWKIGTSWRVLDEGCAKFPSEFLWLLGFALNWSFFLVLEDCTSVYRGRWCSCCSDWSIWKFPLLSSSNDVGAFKIEWFGDGKTAIFPNCLLLSFRKNCEIFVEVRVKEVSHPC